MTTGIPRSQATRNARIAAKPRCGAVWAKMHRDGKPLFLQDFINDEIHIHSCVKFAGHAGKDHVCACGSTKSKPRKPLDVRG